MEQRRRRKHRRKQTDMMCRELYSEADINSKLMFNLRELCRMQRILSIGNSSQKRILMILSKAGGTLPQRELIDRLRIKPGSASEVISKLEATGYVMRSRNEVDGRAMDLSLSEAGQEAALEAIEEQEAQVDQYFTGLTDEEKEELLTLLEKVSHDWDARCLKLDDDRSEARRRRARRRADSDDEPGHRRGPKGRGRGRGNRQGQNQGRGNRQGQNQGRGNRQGQNQGRGNRQGHAFDTDPI